MECMVIPPLKVLLYNLITFNFAKVELLIIFRKVEQFAHRAAAMAPEMGHEAAGHHETACQCKYHRRGTLYQESGEGLVVKQEAAQTAKEPAAPEEPEAPAQPPVTEEAHEAPVAEESAPNPEETEYL